MLFVIGTTHQRAPIEVREKLSLTPGNAAALRAEFGAMPGLREFTVLSTCNRIEFYGVADAPEVVAQVETAFCGRQGFDAEAFRRIRLDLQGAETIRHLIEVSAGLDSQMLGETEIFGQVKAAYGEAQANGSTGPVLNRVFQKAFQAAKHVRTHSAITEGQVSVANVAVELAQSIFGGLADARILLLGAGEIGEKTAKAFQSRGAAALTVASRRFERAMELATTLGTSAMPFEQREHRLHEFDIVVCATSAPDVVVTLAATRAAMQRRPARPLLLVDQALPRDVDPSVSTLENVFLYNLDDLARIAEENRAAREAEVSRCRSMAAERAETLWRQVAGQIDSPRSSSPRDTTRTGDAITAGESS
jgi:glutamyl-tRNA reductase